MENLKGHKFQIFYKICLVAPDKTHRQICPVFSTNAKRSLIQTNKIDDV